MTNQELIDRLTQIIADSDQRMSKTNEMVNNLSSTLTVITGEYAKHLEALSKCRDEQLKIIEVQQEQIRSLQEDLRTALHRNDALVDKMLMRANVNINQ